MSSNENVETAVDVLQQLGLKEYEAKCFVGLSRMDHGTAKELGEATEVPRTRVYDAIRVLQAKGLVEVQHSSPQRFRAVPLAEATETLRVEYEERIDRLRGAIESLSSVETDEDTTMQEVWAMSGTHAVGNRTEQLVSEASEEVVLVLGDERLLTSSLVDVLNDLADDVDLVVGAVSDSLRERIDREVTRAETFVSGLEWLGNEGTPPETVSIGRLLLVDRQAILVSTYDGASEEEHAIFGTGFGNGLVVISRRLMAQGLIPSEDPAPPETD